MLLSCSYCRAPAEPAQVPEHGLWLQGGADAELKLVSPSGSMLLVPMLIPLCFLMDPTEEQKECTSSSHYVLRSSSGSVWAFVTHFACWERHGRLSAHYLERGVRNSYICKGRESKAGGWFFITAASSLIWSSVTKKIGNYFHRTGTVLSFPPGKHPAHFVCYWVYKKKKATGKRREKNSLACVNLVFERCKQM